MRVDTRHFWLFFDWFLDQCFDWFDQCFDILTDVQAAMNNVDWDWARIMMNEVNWHSAVHCKNNLIDLDWEAWDDLIEQKLLYTQHYAHEVQLQILLQSSSRNVNVLFERRIVVTECTSWLF